MLGVDCKRKKNIFLAYSVNFPLHKQITSRADSDAAASAGVSVAASGELLRSFGEDLVRRRRLLFGGPVCKKHGKINSMFP